MQQMIAKMQAEMAKQGTNSSEAVPPTANGSAAALQGHAHQVWKSWSVLRSSCDNISVISDVASVGMWSSDHGMWSAGHGFSLNFVYLLSLLVREMVLTHRVPSGFMSDKVINSCSRSYLIPYLMELRGGYVLLSSWNVLYAYSTVCHRSDVSKNRLT